MTTQQPAGWFSLLETAVKNAESDHLDLIVDQSGANTPLIPALETFSPAIPWCSLFAGLPEESEVDAAPLLIRINLGLLEQRQWAEQLIQHLAKQPRLLTLCSAWSFNMLSEYFTACLDATHCGQPGILRFFDPRIFPHLFTHILLDSQQKHLLRPAMFWSWLDREGEPVWLTGDNASPSEEKPEKIDLDDQQLEQLLIVSDAEMLMCSFMRQNGLTRASEALFHASYRAMREATAANIFLDQEREAFAWQRLQQLQTDPYVVANDPL
ncbi:MULTISPECIES: DUF4123 domain-containing protein [unclassified Brenneria]|uniref:DUF4123 domain-containing protein n=1 Tax=unclassified Brenneria TaxID=2634434 RepID=UPI0029C41EFE|nr:MULTISPECIES: DUF4123 domain-containing protein [unclassified Brenneria]MDX5631158.1 DUF4123 domain-containing protein [Brenneria sp. L3-3Z]MDX5698226.1 DUF4123 domain-containing protein [Brenneria sp. L4-2C]MEE3663627.1 DUF4123 domain-containing protein [Brenneria sp. g21c3]MEE3664928.1 DUF4123 domain-containing protein [Brenneria sp. g21c3]